jgi:hypothetical protein
MAAAVVLGASVAVAVFRGTKHHFEPAVYEALRGSELHLVADLEIPEGATPWQLFYGVLGRGEDFRWTGDRSVLEFLLEEATWRPLFEGMPMSIPLDAGAIFLGDLDPTLPKGFEGHFCQWLYILSETDRQWNRRTVRLPPDGRSGTVQDFVRASMDACHTGSDLSWALPVFLRWGDRDVWENRFGERLSLEDLAIKLLADQDTSLACGGTHWRLAVAISAVEGKRLPPRIRTTLSRRVEELLREAEASFTGEYFALPRGAPEGRNTLVSFHAHSLQWIMHAGRPLEDWTHRAAASLSRHIESTVDLSFDTLCHAHHALRLYTRRVAAARHQHLNR